MALCIANTRSKNNNFGDIEASSITSTQFLGSMEVKSINNQGKLHKLHTQKRIIPKYLKQKIKKRMTIRIAYLSQRKQEYTLIQKGKLRAHTHTVERRKKEKGT